MSTAAPLPVSVSPPTGASALLVPEQLPDDLGVLKTMIVELLASLHAKDRELEGVRHRLNLLLHRIYGPRSERIDPNQLLLFAELAAGQEPAPAAPPPADEEKKSKRRARPHGRRRLPENLPRDLRHHELCQAERICGNCGQTRIDIGVDKSEQLDFRPASLIVIENIVHKYVCPCCARPSNEQPASHSDDGVPSLESSPPADEPVPSLAAAEPATPTEETQKPMEPRTEQTPSHTKSCDSRAEPQPTVIAAVKPDSPIAKGLPGPGLLAHLIVSKYVDHLPLYRLERIYERLGVFLPRSTLCDWLAASAQLLRPLYDSLVSLVLQSRVIHTDDTPVKNKKPPPGSTDIGRLWAYLGDASHPFNVFDFTPNRKRDGPQQFLKNFQGYLQADAFTGYDCLYLPRAADGACRIVEVACNAHARRKFYEARSSDALHSHQALGYYRALYELERQANELQFDIDQRYRMRLDFAVPLLDKFRTWLDGQRAEVLPKSPMGEAIGYALNNWTALARYTEAGFLAIDNNVAEREMKRIAIGRKNWLFVGSTRGGQTAAVLFSFTSTCQRLGVEPWAYLQDVLSRLPTTPADQLATLLPNRWNPPTAETKS